MDNAVMVIQFIAGLSLLVFFHELGHFIAAKAFGVRVLKFYLFFDAFGWRLCRFHFRGTEFGIGWLPVGGYVKMAGDITGSTDESGEEATLPPGQQYFTKPVWQRFVIMLMGIVMNLLLAVLIYSGLFLTYGRNQVNGIGQNFKVVPGKLGAEAGLQPGDQVTAINADSALYEDELLSTHLLHGNTLLSVIRKKGNERVHLHVAVSPKIMQQVASKGLTQFFSLSAGFKVDSFYTNVDLRKNSAFKKVHIIALNGDSVRNYNEFIIRLKESQDKELYLTVIHNGKTSIMPAHRDKDGHIGFSLSDKLPVFKPQEINITQSMGAGTSRVWKTITQNSKGFAEIVSGDVKVSDGLIGPVRLARLFDSRFEPKRFWELVALLSVAIALANLVPFAPFDGGVILVLLWEAFTGKRPGQQFWVGFYFTGLILMLVLSAYVFFNDIRALTT